MKMNCIIVDDEPLARKGMENLVRKVPFLEPVASCSDTNDLIGLICSQPIHLLFMDVEMPGMTGLEFLKSFKDLPPVIITTAFPNYALEGYSLNVVDYLVKPVSFERFYAAVKKAQDYHQLVERANSQTSTADYFFIKCDNKLEKITLEDILFVEAKVNYVVIHTRTRKYLTYLTIKSVEEYLPAELFLKVHKSFVVAISRIQSIEGCEITIAEYKIPMSRNQKDEILEKLVNHKLLKR